MQNLRILIGDNDEIFLESFTLTLNQMGYNVVGTETSGTNLLRKIRNINPDIVIADVSLRGMGGFEISDIVEGEGLCPCIIIFKGNPSEYMLKLDKKLVYSYIQKPLETNSVKYIVDNAYYSFKRIMEVEKKLQERKFVEKAKGLLMSRYGFTEDKAYEYLKKKSMDKGTPIIKIAKSVIEIIEKKNQESI
jgi:response regulator NasT